MHARLCVIQLYPSYSFILLFNLFLAVHGFNSTEYHVAEGTTLFFEIKLLVKGEADPNELFTLPGIISTQSITAS